MQKKILLYSVLGLMLIGCNRSPKDISEMKDATPADSMMYYFGEMQAYNYWQDAETDTVLRSESARRAFMDGFRAALKMDRESSAYNKGLQLGLRLAIRLREFKDSYGDEFSEEILASSLDHFISNDSLLDIVAAQRGYYKVKDRYDLNQAHKENNDAIIKLARKGRSSGFEMINDTLFALDITPAGNAPYLKEGDRVAVEVTASTLEGKEIVTRQFPDSLTLGEGRVPTIVRYAIYTMTDGQTRQFMTTPRTLFGKRYASFNLPYDEPVIFTVKAHR